jgi:hypothetical protein
MRFVILAFFLALSASCSYTSVSPDKDNVYTSTRYVCSVACAPDGSVWAATQGGILHRNKDGQWTKYTVQDGLPSNEAQRVLIEGDTVTALFPNAKASWRDGRWSAEMIKQAIDKDDSHALCSAVWRGRQYEATFTALQVREGKKLQDVIFPPSKGSHISALATYGDHLLAAFYGDGFWQYDGKSWSTLDVKLPQEAREITTLASNKECLWIGTRRQGVWQYDGRKWHQHLQPDEPYAHNCQNMALFDNNLYISTMEDGFAVKTSSGWEHVAAPTLSSDSPRQMTQFKGCLYVRHGNGKVDKFDGDKWVRDVFSNLPRKQSSAIASDATRLYVAQWGGWSEYDGKDWEHHLDLKELQGWPVTAIYAEGDRLWIGTQGKGLAEIDRSSGKITWHDERRGLPDDWVKVISRVGDTLYAGTFVGGAAWLDGERWSTSAEMKDQEVTALKADDKGGIVIATRNGIWNRTSAGKLLKLSDISEVQVIQPVDDGLWIGTRTGIRYIIPGH